MCVPRREEDHTVTVQGRKLSETENYVKALYYGNPKQGKTTAMAGAARLGLVVAVDTEGEGWLGAPLRKRGVPTENIIKFTATTYGEMEQVFWEIRGMFDDAQRLNDPSLAPVAVCVDHLTDLEARLIRAAVVQRQSKLRKPLESRAATGSAEAKAALADINPFQTELQDYGVWTNQARHLLRMYRDLPCHVAFAAHFRTEMGIKVPALTEKFRVDLMGSMNMILACTTMPVGDSLAYVAYTQESDGWVGGDRFSCMRPMVVNPSFDRVIAAAAGELDFDTDPEQQAFKQLLKG